MHFGKPVLIALLSLTILSGCAQSTATTTPKIVTRTKTSYVSKRTAADTAAWSSAKAVSRANAASAKQLSQQSSTLTQASSQSSALTASQSSAHSASVAASSSLATSTSSVLAASVSSSHEASKAASQQAATATSTQTTKATSTNRFSGDTDTAQPGRIVGNTHSKIYHVETDHNYRMAEKNVSYFSTEEAAQAAGYRKSLR
ncbi:cell surface protein [Lactobacillus sp. CBA3606]|uniref:sunset domain-containing protein n=1 Tax=Lactobacillus sp. CBA3606 TaxID=2099789 RepID=UPI000CFD31CB|nr:cell surface protein [Lactobacillus sp. CBA3606]AVK64471.1 cell surface protein [Lactobacillus sp. CBA3606]